jgi:hypothetical protein
MRSGYVTTALAVSAYLVISMGAMPGRYVELAIAAAKSLV